MPQMLSKLKATGLVVACKISSQHPKCLGVQTAAIQALNETQLSLYQPAHASGQMPRLAHPASDRLHHLLVLASLQASRRQGMVEANLIKAYLPKSSAAC